MSMDVIQHTGVLGMKWGIRRARSSSSSSSSSKTKQHVSSESSESKPELKDTKAKGSISSSIKAMSDAELKSKINRIQMEKQYAQLTTREKSAGEKFIKSVLSDAGKQTATKYTAMYMSKMAESLLKQSVKAAK